MRFNLGDDQTEISEDGCFVAPNAAVIGRVIMRPQSSVWFGAVVRADNDQITIGPKSNVQDCAVLHTDSGCPIVLGEGVTVGHHAMLHGCDVGDYSLIGINAVVLNGAKIGRFCIIGANALIPEGVEIPDGSLVIGSPGRVKRELSEEEKRQLIASAEHYVENALKYTRTLQPA
ncbi:gamma carbonic anhydrase family protein [Hahella sp. CR1]|uniref:gamma carbonic anhydrase family protein n=1 Tax=Hahella sp. CR1 TaxID=2992807 RepID=UPI002441A9B9|nr:gamma carbonic anhydrase family protein [Hahella sp. CR1]MDG9672214.1 gamma carbonic anhydrase family protein [Hahella sp. CR1]